MAIQAKVGILIQFNGDGSTTDLKFDLRDVPILGESGAYGNTYGLKFDASRATGLANLSVVCNSSNITANVTSSIVDGHSLEISFSVAPANASGFLTADLLF